MSIDGEMSGSMSAIAIYQQLRFIGLKFAVALQSSVMRFSLRLSQVCFLVLLLPRSVSFAQAVTPAHPPTLGADGVYEVAAADLKLDSSPKVEFPLELSAYELTDSVVIAVTVSPEGRVKKAKAVSGQIHALKEAAEKTVKKWTFQPYLVNGSPVPVRTEMTFTFDNTLDHYRDPNGDIPVHLDERTSAVLLVKRVQPQYPADARAGHIQGDVELRVIVGEDGRVQALHIIKGHPMLAPAAYNAVRQWEFKPYVENGKTLPVDTRVTMRFFLS